MKNKTISWSNNTGNRQSKKTRHSAAEEANPSPKGNTTSKEQKMAEKKRANGEKSKHSKTLIHYILLIYL